MCQLIDSRNFRCRWLDTLLYRYVYHHQGRNPRSLLISLRLTWGVGDLGGVVVDLIHIFHR